MNTIEGSTFALSTSVTFLRLAIASSKAARHTRSLPARVIRITSRTSSPSPSPCDSRAENSPSVLSRTSTKSIPPAE